MALDIVAQDIIIDETSGPQDDDTSASNSTITYLLSLDGSGGLSSPQVAFQSDFVVASASAGETISSVSLTQNSSGTAFSTTDGVNSGIRTVDGNYVWLFLDAAHSNVVIGVIGTSDVNAEPAETGPLAFSFALVSTSATHYDLYTAQYVPLLHPDATNPDDEIDLSGKVFATVSGSTTVSFTGANAPPGKHEFYALNSPTDASKQILVTGFLESANAIPNVSTQGFGVDNQSINPTEKLQVDFVTGSTLAAGSASQIAYGSHIETITQAGFTINQITPSSPDKRVDITITALNVQGNEQGLNFYDGSTTTNSPITSITLTGTSGFGSTITTNGTYATGSGNVTISGLGTNVVTITGLDNITTVNITTSSSFDRLLITGVDANEGCDITEFHYSTTTPNAYTEGVGSFINFDDDGPAPSGLNYVGHVDEDAMTGSGGGDLSTGIVDASDDGDGIVGEQDEITFSQADLGATISAGADNPAIFSLVGSIAAGTAVKTTSGANVFSKGDQVFWRVSSGVLQGVVNAGTGTERVVFTITVNDQGTVTKTDDTFTFDLKDQLDHGNGAGELANLLLNITPAFTATDADGDPVNFGTNTPIRMQVENDTPTFTAQISDGTVEFANDSTGVATGNLHGAIGADDTNATNTSQTPSVKQYTFVPNSWTEPHTVFPDLDGVLSADGTKITFYSTSVTADQNSSTAVYEITLNQTANSGAGSYTFTVLQPAPVSQTNFDFTDLPSGQNLMGVIASDKTDLTEGGLLVFPTNPDLNADGTMTNVSGTINTSKGGGPVTIGNGNQAFDHTDEGAFFCYVDNPASSSVGGLGLTQTSADDADTVAFDGTIEVTSASVEIVQASGAGTTKRPGPSMQITAYDIDPQTVGHLGDVGVETDADAFVLDPTATDAQVSIIGVKIHDSTGAVIEYRTNVDNGATNGGTLQDSDDAGTGVSAADDSLVGISFFLDDDGGTPADPTDDIYSIIVSNLKANYTVEFITEDPHDLAKVENVSGSFDIGGFNVFSNNNVAAQDFDFQVQINDYDNDIFTSALAQFSVHINETTF